MLLKHEQGTWTAAELTRLCGANDLLATDLGEGSRRSRETKMGTLAGRFINERFGIDDQVVVFRRTKDRKGNLYHVGVLESAEP